MPSARKWGAKSIRGDWRMASGFEQGHHASLDQRREIERSINEKYLRKSREARAAEPLNTVALRCMTIDDAAYVLDSWSNSYRRSPATGPIEREVFNIEQRARINRLVQRRTSRVFIACEQADARVIRGWICFEAPRAADGIPVVHYVCVQPSHQLQGIGTALIALARKTAKDPKQFMWTTHETLPMRHCRPKWHLLFNPYLLELPERAAHVTAKDLK